MTKQFMKEAMETLIKRGVATKEDFSESSVSEQDIAQFEQDFGVKVPDSLKAYLMTNSFEFHQIMAAVPEDCCHGLLPEEEEDYYEMLWLDILSVPKENPLSDLRDRMEGFREVIEDGLIENVSLDDVKHMIPVGDWMAGAGVMVMDLSKPEENVDIDDEDTWNLRWFDHEEFDWDCYRRKDGTISGSSAFPNLETMLNYYFCGLCDEAYDKQAEEDGEEPIDYSKLIDR